MDRFSYPPAVSPAELNSPGRKISRGLNAFRIFFSFFFSFFVHHESLTQCRSKMSNYSESYFFFYLFFHIFIILDVKFPLRKACRKVCLIEHSILEWKNTFQCKSGATSNEKLSGFSSLTLGQK